MKTRKENTQMQSFFIFKKFKSMRAVNTNLRILLIFKTFLGIFQGRYCLEEKHTFKFMWKRRQKYKSNILKDIRLVHAHHIFNNHYTFLLSFSLFIKNIAHRRKISGFLIRFWIGRPSNLFSYSSDIIHVPVISWSWH